MDAAFAEVIDALFDGHIDPRDAWDHFAKMNDSSEMHVNQASTKRGRVTTRIGQGLNALAIGAGGHAVLMAGKDERIKDAAAAGSKWAKAVRAPHNLYSKTKVAGKLERTIGRGGKFASAAAAGALGLHGAELVGDSIAAHALQRQHKQQTGVLKAMSTMPKQPTLGKQPTQAKQPKQAAMPKAPTMSGKAGLKPTGNKSAVPGLPASGSATPGLPSLQPQKMPTTGMTPTNAANFVATGKAPGLPSMGGSAVGKSWQIDAVISKRDDSKHQIFGWATVTHIDGEEVIDRQGDYIPLEEIEKSAYQYVLTSRKGTDMHERTEDDRPMTSAVTIESMVFTPEKVAKMGLNPDTFPRYGWWIGQYVPNDDDWEDVVTGKRTGFSIHGKGRRTEMSM
jgi:hypothetical protein